MMNLRNLLRRAGHPLAKRDGRRGAAAVEFALVLPLFVAVLFGVIEYGWVFYQNFSVASAVRDGLRVGVTVAAAATPDPGTTAVKRTQDLLTGVGINPAGVTINAIYNGSTPSKTLTLSATMPYKALIGFVPVPSKIAYSMTMLLELQ
ncbi:MAG TPA: TadE/TadG family type IV pilus assembly protein [Polyangia bacterium]|jgi:Flp pilus assembly protein TadG|nr:TadE/TadG family type IV pilus assembly protein [Polyangia bacterium]